MSDIFQYLKIINQIPGNRLILLTSLKNTRQSAFYSKISNKKKLLSDTRRIIFSHNRSWTTFVIHPIFTNRCSIDKIWMGLDFSRVRGFRFGETELFLIIWVLSFYVLAVNRLQLQNSQSCTCFKYILFQLLLYSHNIWVMWEKNNPLLHKKMARGKGSCQWNTNSHRLRICLWEALSADRYIIL